MNHRVPDGCTVAARRALVAGVLRRSPSRCWPRSRSSTCSRRRRGGQRGPRTRDRRSGAGSPVAAGAAERAIGTVRVARSGGRAARLRLFGDLGRGARLPRGAVPPARRCGSPSRWRGGRAALARGAADRVSRSGDGAPPAVVALDRRAASP